MGKSTGGRPGGKFDRGPARGKSAAMPLAVEANAAGRGEGGQRVRVELN
jgi:hypothetical protein